MGTLLLGITLGAASGVKISATLQNQAISYNGSLSGQQVISYNSTTYVPLRSFSNLVNIPVDYKNSTIYLGGNNTVTAPAKQTKFTFSINGVSTGASYDNEDVAIVDVSFTNNSGESKTPSGSLYNVTAYQNGVELETTFDSNLAEYDSYTSVQSGATLNYSELFVIKDRSPITIEIKEFLGDKKVSKTLNLN